MTGRERHRENQPTESDAKYWKRTVSEHESFFIEAWMLNSLPNQQGHISVFETSRL